MPSLQATLVIEDEQKAIYAWYMLGEEALSFASNASGPVIRPIPTRVVNIGASSATVGSGASVLLRISMTLDL